MTLRGLFVSGDGRLRAGWRVLAYVALFFSIATIVLLLLKKPLEAMAKASGYEDAVKKRR